MAIQLKATLMCDSPECDAEAEATVTAWPNGRVSHADMPPGWRSAAHITFCPACVERHTPTPSGQEQKGH